MKFSAALFHQTEADIRARLGDRFNPSSNYPNYDGLITIPADQLPALLDYLSAGVTNDKGEVTLKMAGWKKTSQAGKIYLSVSVTEDYRIQKAIDERRAQQAAQPNVTAGHATNPQAAAPQQQYPQQVQQLATNFNGAVTTAEDVPF